MATSQRSEVPDPLRAARAALARGAWEEARAGFDRALGAVESAEAWDGLGWAAWWLGDADLTIRARERAFRLLRDAGDRGGAARVAAFLAADHREFRGEVATGQGWLARARRLLDGVPPSADHGWLALLDGDFALNADGDPLRAAELSAGAARLGRDLGVPDLEAVGLAQEGIALVLLGRVEEGMGRLDEATAIARTEDLQLPMSGGWAMCCVISACSGVGDFPRAAEWCDAMRAFTDRWGGRHLLGVCRSAYGRVLATRGEWDAAESELTGAVADLEASRPGMVSGSLVRLAELRLRQGRADEARALFERAGPAGAVGLGTVALEAGDAVAAADAAGRALRRLPPAVLLERLPALELRARALAALGRFDEAEDASREAGAAAVALGTPYLRGRAALVAGELAAARGDHAAAQRAFEDAADALRDGAAPYDAALARLGLAAALAGQGRGAHAEQEARAARETFAALGAARDVTAADDLLATLEDGVAAEGGAGGPLTSRELEVLRLVARGLSDAEIGRELHLSPHTVHRHVANVRVKLRLPSRAAAVAYAAREGLL